MSGETKIKSMGAIPHTGGVGFRVGTQCPASFRHRIVRRLGRRQASHAGRGGRPLVRRCGTGRVRRLPIPRQAFHWSLQCTDLRND